MEIDDNSELSEVEFKFTGSKLKIIIYKITKIFLNDKIKIKNH